MTDMTNRESRRFEESLQAAERARDRPAEPLRRLTPSEFERATEIFHESVRKMSLQVLDRATATLDVDALEDALREVMALADRCRELLKQPITRAAPTLTGAQRAESLIAGLVSVAQTLAGGWCFGSGREIDRSLETLLDRLVTVSEHADYWRSQSPGVIGNLLMEPSIAEALESRGVLAWRARDGGTRVVRVNWLEDPADIAAFVRGEPQPGRRCRFCQAFEPDQSMELESFDQPHKRPTVTSVGWAGHRRVLDYGKVSVHSKCRPHWERWLEIAENFSPTPEAA